MKGCQEAAQSLIAWAGLLLSPKPPLASVPANPGTAVSVEAALSTLMTTRLYFHYFLF